MKKIFLLLFFMGVTISITFGENQAYYWNSLNSNEKTAMAAGLVQGMAGSIIFLIATQQKMASKTLEFIFQGNNPSFPLSLISVVDGINLFYNNPSNKNHSLGFAFVSVLSKYLPMTPFNIPNRGKYF